MSKQNMIRAGLVNINDVLPYVQFAKGKSVHTKIKNYQEYKIKMDSTRYRLFALKGCKCVTCGIEGKYFAIEKHANNKNNPTNRYHLNLYATDEKGKEVLMTVDHITPASKGGKRHTDNLQPMCTICNTKKGNKI